MTIKKQNGIASGNSIFHSLFPGKNFTGEAASHTGTVYFTDLRSKSASLGIAKIPFRNAPFGWPFFFPGAADHRFFRYSLADTPVICLKILEK